MLKAVISRFGREKSWRQRPSHRFRRTLVRAAAAVGARVEVEHVLPGEVLEGLHADRLHLIYLCLSEAPLDRLHRAAIQLRKIHIEQRGLYVELNSEWAVAEQEVEGQDIDQVRTAIEVPESRV